MDALKKGKGKLNEAKSFLPDSVADQITAGLDQLDALNPEKILNEVSEYINHPIRKLWPVLRPSLIPFFISSIGSLGAGFLLNWVITWPIFDDLPQLTIMLYPFMGMVTNIMSTLSSRMTAVKDMENWADLKQFLWGNLKVVQCQALLTSLFASVTSVAASAVKESTRSKINLNSTLLLSSTSVLTSFVTNTVLTTVYAVLVFTTKRFNIQLDPQAAFTIVSTVRDICAISMLALISSTLQSAEGIAIHLALLSPILLTPVLMFLSWRNPHTKSVITGGWGSLFGAVVLEQPGGVIMQGVFKQHPVGSALAPIVNGIARNLVGIHYHLFHFLQEEIGKINMPDFIRNFVGPLVSNFINSQITSLLLKAIIPAHLVALGMIYLGQLQLDYTLTLTLPFVVAYALAVLIQLYILLWVSSEMVFRAKKYGYDPHQSVMPMITSITNMLGSFALAAIFGVLGAINDPNGTVIERVGNGTIAGGHNATLI